LNKYFTRIFMNGAPTPLIVQLLGILLPKQTHVIANPNASPAILSKANQTSNKINFNGDDAIQFIKVMNNISINIDSIEGNGGNPHDIFDTLQLDTLDQIGITNVYPGNQGWTVGGTGSTKNSILIRNHAVASGISDSWSCGQYQWKIIPQNDVSNLGVHQNVCSAANDITFSFANATTTGTTPKYFEFDIMVSANTNSTYYDGAQFRIPYNTAVFGTNILSNNNVIITAGTAFNSITYYNPQLNVDASASKMNIYFSTDINQSSWNRTLVTTIPMQLLHFKITIQNCGLPVNIDFADQALVNTPQYALTATASILSVYNYDNTSYQNNPLNNIACQVSIANFNSPVNAGVGDVLTINGYAFGTTKGNGQVKFKNADDGGATYIQKLNGIDYLSWTDTL